MFLEENKYALIIWIQILNQNQLNFFQINFPNKRQKIQAVSVGGPLNYKGRPP